MKRNVEKRIAAIELRVFDLKSFEDLDEAILSETLRQVSHEDLDPIIAFGDPQPKGPEQRKAESRAFRRFSSLLNEKRRSAARGQRPGTRAKS